MINTSLRQQATQEWPAYANNPFSFSVPEPVYLDQMFVVDLNGDGLMDFTYRSETKLFTFDHFGTFLWSAEIDNPRTDITLGNNRGTGHGAADVDGDGIVEIVALNRSNMMMIFDGSNGTVEDTLALPIIGANNKWVYIAVANLRGNGDRDVIFQTMDTSGLKENSKVNRNLLAWDLENNLELWRVVQDDDHRNGTYEGYWGVGHGSFQCADVDGDGRDEVVGANMVKSDGSVIDLRYPTAWVRYGDVGSTDHFDALSIGDFRPDLPGLEWLLTEEEDRGNENFHTTLMSASSIIWRNMTALFKLKEREPQNIAAGNFDPRRPFCEIFIRSRFSGPDSSQHPWVYDAFGVEFADYATETVLPVGFSAHEYGNKEGIEQMATIDWFGGSMDYMAAKARHVDGNIGIFDAVSGAAIWHTMDNVPATRASLIYVADISGDSREEMITYEADSTIKVYWNEVPNSNPPRPRKWEDPLYRRTKQNWNYYSPGGYINTNSGSTALTMISPNHGEHLLAGTMQEILWSAAPEIASVSLQFSTDAAQSWHSIIDSTENDGAYAWTVPEIGSSQCLVRVVDPADENQSDASDAFFVIIDPTPVGVADATTLTPKEFALYQNHPNPFNPETRIEFDVPRTAAVRLIIYNVLGIEVKRLLDEEKPAGRHRSFWDGRDQRGRKTGSGIYFYSLQAGEFRAIKKMLLVH